MHAPVNDANSRQPHSLEESLYATVAYFDMFNYPLTPCELWTFLLYVTIECPISEVLEKSKSHPCLEWSNGFIHIKGREFCVEERLDRYVHSERKVRKALRFARYCSLIPGVLMIALCNTLAFSHARNGSDIDLFIVSRNGYLWFVRAACIVLSFFFGPRLSEQHMKDALCLSFFATKNELDLSSLALRPLRGIDDVYLAVWTSRLVPLYDEGGIANSFWEANRWTTKIIPHRMFYIPNHMRRICHNIALRIFKKCVTAAYVPFRMLMEPICKKIQQKKFPATICATANAPGSGVVVTDTLLKFHLNDRREYFQEQLIERMRSYRSMHV